MQQKTEIPEPYLSAHKDSSSHRAQVLSSDYCACFYCRTVWPPSEIKEWIDDKQTALCPRCGVNAVLPSTTFSDGSGSLLKMQKYWFADQVNVRPRKFHEW